LFIFIYCEGNVSNNHWDNGEHPQSDNYNEKNQYDLSFIWLYLTDADSSNQINISPKDCSEIERMINILIN